MSAFFRHARVWPSTRGRAALASVICDPAAQAALALWDARDWPLVVRRSDADELQVDDTLAVGLALPPSLGKRRFKFRLPRDAIAAHAPPFALDDVVAVLGPPLQRALTPLARAATRARIVLRVFGSAAWQAQTGLDYLHADSDLDLLMQPTTSTELQSTIALLERVAPNLAIRLDGEIVFPGGDAVAWREWARENGPAHVLVKSAARVALMARSDLAARLRLRKLAA